jgi:exosome complex component RRP4
MREIVTPGELLSDQPIRLENTYVENNKTYAKVLGLYDKEKGMIVSLEGIWTPRIDDKVIGIIVSSRNSVYEVDLTFFGKSILIGSKFDRHTYNNGDVIEAEVKDIENRKTIILWRPRVLYGGTIIEIKPTKIPRVIGKANTMVQQISELTKSTIVVGNNGIIWIKGGNVALASAAIRKIEMEAHTQGLTERIKKMLEEQTIQEK